MLQYALMLPLFWYHSPLSKESDWSGSRNPKFIFPDKPVLTIGWLVDWLIEWHPLWHSSCHESHWYRPIIDWFSLHLSNYYYYYFLCYHAGFELIYDQDLISSYDWFLKADDDTFVLVDNLMKGLQSFDPSQKMAFGHKLLTWEEVRAPYFAKGVKRALGMSSDFVLP